MARWAPPVTAAAAAAATATADAFWSVPETVEHFASREPDRRLMALLAYAGPALRALDLGCAGGRNTEPLARHGADVFAVDRSQAMVERTRERLSRIVGREQARSRVLRRSMHELQPFPDERFDLVVALGVYPSAGDMDTFLLALDETARVLAPGGSVLVSTFSPGSRPTGEALERVDGQPGVYRWRGGRRAVLPGHRELDRMFEERGLEAAPPTSLVRVPMGTGYRITINASYRKPGGGRQAAMRSPTSR